MGKCRAAIVLQRSEQRLGIDLVAGAVEHSCAIVVAQVETVGGDRAITEVRDVGTQVASL